MKENLLFLLPQIQTPCLLLTFRKLLSSDVQSWLFNILFKTQNHIWISLLLLKTNYQKRAGMRITQSILTCINLFFPLQSKTPTIHTHTPDTDQKNIYISINVEIHDFDKKIIFFEFHNKLQVFFNILSRVVFFDSICKENRLSVIRSIHISQLFLISIVSLALYSLSEIQSACSVYWIGFLNSQLVLFFYFLGCNLGLFTISTSTRT